MKKGTTAGAALLCSGLALAGGTHGYESGDVLWRVAAATVVPQAGGDALAAGLPGATAAFTEHTRPSLGLTYMWFDSLGLNVSVVWPFSQSLYLELADGDVRAGVASTMPMTLALEYHLPKLYRASVYLMAGYQYTRYSAEAYNVGTVPGVNSIDFEDAGGAAVGLGVDWDLSGRWSLNASALATTATTRIEFSGPAGRVDEIDAEPDPVIWQLGLTRTF